MLLHAEATAVAKVRAAVVWADVVWLVVSRLGMNAASSMAGAARHSAPADVCCSVSTVARAAVTVYPHIEAGWLQNQRGT